MNPLLKQIQERYAAGERLKYLFFWGHTPGHGQTVGPFIFSQWYPSKFTVDGLEYQTAEHWMMAEKARLFGDKEIAEKIIQATTPGHAKDLGRQVKNFDNQKWLDNRFDIVRTGTYHKFNAYPDMKEYLLSTADRILVEASPVDNIWGIGMAKDHPDAENPLKWKGENLLGFALMDVREQMKK
ncbi:NADAR family protein [Cesiribacter sp. SM1]|uniref:NADAR family protein n=1 Tax=Cesiribacter sp. SM1 TaxID=2861196 RepID=UPI001CD24A72|nr:NADAR family protein [Cesiribacter sp. SM1]